MGTMKHSAFVPSDTAISGKPVKVMFHNSTEDQMAGPFVGHIPVLSRLTLKQIISLHQEIYSFNVLE